AYRVPSPGAKAAQHLERLGKTLKPGQKVRFLHTHQEPTVWGITNQPLEIDTRRYETLLIRAATYVFQPLGVDEATLRVWLHYPPELNQTPKVFSEKGPWALPLESLLLANQPLPNKRDEVIHHAQDSHPIPSPSPSK
ncbi:MAG TPA: hypothetical protein PK530_05285, partial [Anaerolineales bacterium]|nr:hypothetical protein [Anaerolineales bacterium]